MTPRPTLADRDAVRKQVKQFYLGVRRNGATITRAFTLALDHAVKLGATDPNQVAQAAVVDVDGEDT